MVPSPMTCTSIGAGAALTGEEDHPSGTCSSTSQLHAHYSGKLSMRGILATGY